MGRTLDLLLWPAERAFRAAVATRNLAYDRGWVGREWAPIPVISVGNLDVGGSGKTPVAAWIAARLAEWGHRPAIAVRGYARDEILVHRELNPAIPVFAARRRVEAVAEAASNGCDTAVLDDGFQHRSLARDLDVALVSAESWEGRRRMLPRGRWREPDASVGRAGLVVVTRKCAGPEQSVAIAQLLGKYLPARRIVSCYIGPTALRPLHAAHCAELPLEWLDGRVVLCVTSLADPAPLVRQMESLGAEVELLAFPDHHDFSAADVRRIMARASGRPLLMTRKEAVKLRTMIANGMAAFFVEQRVKFDAGEAAVDAYLREAISR